MKLLTLIGMSLVLIACQPGTGEFLPDPDENQTPPNNGSDLLEQIQDTIFTPICIECHIGSTAPLGLRLENTDIAYLSLVNVASVGDPSFDRVEPGEAENSFLVLKVRGDPRAGQRMPLGRPPLSDENIQLIVDWINQGALPATQTAVSTQVVRVTTVEPAKSETSHELLVEFNQAVLADSVNHNSVLIYYRFEDQDFLLPINDYSIDMVRDNAMRVVLKFQNIPANHYKLVFNDPSANPILDRRNRLVDGDKNNEEGGVYEYQFETQNH